MHDEILYRRVARWAYDPPAFAREAFVWPEGAELTPYQEDALGLLILSADGRVAVRGPHGLGKTAMMAIAIIWFAITREVMQVDWKCVSTASVHRQLTRYLWPEVHTWVARLKWDEIPLDKWRPRLQLLDTMIKGEFGEAFMAASTDPGNIEGAHAMHLLYVFDEAKLIKVQTFQAIAGAFSNVGAKDYEAYALAGSTPGPTAGPFYDINRRRPGYEDWTVRAVSFQELVDAGRSDWKWAEQRAREFGGKKSAAYVTRVLGEFASSSEESLIPLDWIEKAHERWYEIQTGSRTPISGPRTLGVDVARGGADRTVILKREGNYVSGFATYDNDSTMKTAGFVQLEAQGGYTPIVDAIGVGGGVVDRMRELGLPVVAYNGAERTELKFGELGFVNTRSAAWWQLRVLLDPDNPNAIAIPPDDSLTGELTAPTWDVQSGGNIRLEPKDRVQARIGRSPDIADGLAMAYWREPEVVKPIEESGSWSGSGPSIELLWS